MEQAIRKFATIKFVRGPLAGNEFHITRPVVTMGRHSSNDIVVSGADVSEHHALIEYEDGVWRITKLSYLHPLIIMRQSVERALLQHQCVVGLGWDNMFLFLLADHVDVEDRGPGVASIPVETDRFSPEVTSDWYASVPTLRLDESVLVQSAQSISHFSEPATLIYDKSESVKDKNPTDRLQLQRVEVIPHVWNPPTEILEFSAAGSALLRRNRFAAPAILPPVEPVLLTEQRITIGRLSDNEVMLKHPQVSAHHAHLIREEQTYRLMDLGSTNHTYVNGAVVNNVLLARDDEIRIGPFRLVYTGTELRQYDESTSIGVDVVNLNKKSSNQTILLDNISLSIPPSSFIAIVGASGTGKSTLLDAMSGLRPASRGSVYYNGQDYSLQSSLFSAQLGYVPQEDIMHRDLTVERALYYVARLRLPADFSSEQIEQRIDEVLDDVEMAHRRALPIKNLSGGQRKRVSIALELLANPGIFFLDEPTSGLDPGLDRKMMKLLRKLSDRGQTIILVTHATTNIDVCDAVCFLAQGGRMAYFGPPQEAKAYFQQLDFADIYNYLEPTDENPNRPQEAQERFLQSDYYRKYITEPLKRISLSDQNEAAAVKRAHTARSHRFWSQLLILCQRYLELLWNDKWNLSILLLQAPVVGVILFILARTLGEAKIFQPPVPLGQVLDTQRFLFLLSFTAIMFGCVNSSREIVKEVNVYRRERTVNLGILPYLCSKILILSLLCLLQCAILLVIMSQAAPFYQGILFPGFLEAYITLVLASLSGVLVGLTISALVRNNDQAMSFIPLVLIPQVVFSGSLFPLKGVQMQVFSSLFILRWAMASLGSIVNLSMYGDRIFESCVSCSTYHHNEAYLLLTWIAMVVVAIVLSLFSIWVLKLKDVIRS